MGFSVGRMPNSPLAQYISTGIARGLQTRAAKQEAILGRQHQKTMQDDRQNEATEVATKQFDRQQELSATLFDRQKISANNLFNRNNLLQQLEYHRQYKTGQFEGTDPVTGKLIDKTDYGVTGNDDVLRSLYSQNKIDANKIPPQTASQIVYTKNAEYDLKQKKEKNTLVKNATENVKLQEGLINKVFNNAAIYTKEKELNLTMGELYNDYLSEVKEKKITPLNYIQFAGIYDNLDTQNNKYPRDKKLLMKQKINYKAENFNETINDLEAFGIPSGGYGGN